MLFAGPIRHPQYTPDGLAYARFAERDAGRSERDATLQARSFYESTPLMAAPRYRRLVEIDPSVAFAASRIFANRILYPALVAALIPAAGLRALFVVSAISYVVFGLALFWLLYGFGRLWSALGLTAIALALPLTRSLAASDLTDMLALALWTIALGALLQTMLRGRSALLLSLLGAASILLVLTRPTPYLIVLPALTAAVLRGMWLELAVCALSVVAFAVTAAITHAFGIAEQLRWIYAHEPRAEHRPFAQWYRDSLTATLKAAAVLTVRSAGPAVALAFGIYSTLRGSVRDEAWVLIAAFIACAIAIFVNPVANQIPRVVAAPLLPVFCAMVQSALAQPTAGLLAGRRRARAR